MTERKQPFVVDEPAGPKHLCACGGSKNLPYCDGTHKGTGTRPFAVELTEAKRVAWCGCGRSADRPYCDGTHKTL